MSSLRNAVKRVTHKERDQPQARKHLGHLEKKKDYRVRAKDYHRKEDRLNAMRQTASMRNPDEFYFGMHNAEIRDGHHRKTQQAKQKEFEAKVGVDTIKLMKGQDLSYVRLLKQQDVKKLQRLQTSLHYIDESVKSSQRQHTIFVESQDEAETFNVAEHFETLPELAGRTFNRPRVAQLALHATGGREPDNDDEADPKQLPSRKERLAQRKEMLKTAKTVAKARLTAYRELEARTERIRAMELAESHLVTEKLVASKGRKRKIREAEDGKPAQYLWRRKRLR